MSATRGTAGDGGGVWRETGGDPEYRAPRLPYAPALDGLRAMAVLAVLLYHADVPWLAGGFLGVDVFFVISGYLITALLLAEWRQHGCVDLGAFWLRRARRLLPALAALLVVVVGFAVVFLPDEVAGLRGDVLSSAVYVNNWYQVFGHRSYFQSLGRPSPLRHLWSLAVEEQFYLLWPPLFALVMRRGGSRFTLWAVVAGALASSLWMGALHQPDADPSRPYYGTDTRAAGLLIGAAVAFILPPKRRVAAPSAWKQDVFGAAALGGLALCFAGMNPYQPFLYRGGFALIGVLTAVLIAVGTHPHEGWIRGTLSCSALRWVGARSYGIYLWHFPVFMLMRPQLDVPADGLALQAARFAITALLAAASYRFLETPIRRGDLGRSWQVWRAARGRTRRQLGLRWYAACACAALLFTVVGASMANARPPAPPAYLCVAPASDVSIGHAMLPTPDAESAATGLVACVLQPPATSAAPAAVSRDFPMQGVAGESVAVTAIGDSVMLGVTAELKGTLGADIVLDADQGRLPWTLPAVARRLHAEGKVNPIVVIHIGNNGQFSARVFDRTMAELKEACRVVVLNVKVPRNWQDINNAMLEAAVRRYTNAVLVDWHGASADRPELFWKDGLHLRPAGARVYAGLVATAVRGEVPARAPASDGLAATR